MVSDIIADSSVSARVNFLTLFLLKNNFSVSRNLFLKTGLGGLKMENFENFLVFLKISFGRVFNGN